MHLISLAENLALEQLKHPCRYICSCTHANLQNDIFALFELYLTSKKAFCHKRASKAFNYKNDAVQQKYLGSKLQHTVAGFQATSNSHFLL